MVGCGDAAGDGLAVGIGVGVMIGSGIGVTVGEVANVKKILVDAFIATMPDNRIIAKPLENMILLSIWPPRARTTFDIIRVNAVRLYGRAQ